MDRIIIVVAVAIVAVVVAVVLERRRPEAPTQSRWARPVQLDRADFEARETPWLVAVFSSATCNACGDAVEKAKLLAGPEVAVQEIEVTRRPDLHRRYAIDAVPMVLIADAEGVVRRSFVGPPAAGDLWGAMAELRSGDASQDE